MSGTSDNLETPAQTIQRFLESWKGGEAPELAKTDDPFHCPYCDGSGWIYYRNKDGKPRAKQCKCMKMRKNSVFQRQSGINPSDYARYTLEAFKPDNGGSRRILNMARTYINGKYKNWIVYTGRPGTGKTHICIAICQALVEEHHYFQYRREIQRLKGLMYKDEKQYSDLMEKWIRWPNVYIDDFLKGAWKDGNVQQQDLQIMFEIINGRYINKNRTIISSEYSIPQILDADEAIGSRIAEMAGGFVMDVQGENRRLK